MEGNYFPMLWGFLPYINMNRLRLCMCPPSWALLPPPSPAYSSGLSQSADCGCPASCSELALVIILHMVMYMFQCYSLKSSHPHLLPLSPKVCSLHLCLLCRPACRIVVTIFLCCSVARSCLTLCDAMDCSMSDFPALHHVLELAQTHVHWVSDAIQPSCPLSSPSPAFSLFQHQCLF